MKLSGYNFAEVPRSKIVDYLLSDAHPSGRAKAAFFTRFGYKVAEWEALGEALRTHAGKHTVRDPIYYRRGDSLAGRPQS